MSSAALREFDGIAVGIIGAHRALPRLLMRRLEKFHSARFELLIKRVEMIRGQLNVNARPVASANGGTADGEEADGTAPGPTDANHREIGPLVDLDRKSELAAIEFDRALNAFDAERQSLQTHFLHSSRPQFVETIR